MSKRKGVSLEDKRKRMLEIFYEKKDVFQLKELEKLGPSEKGVIAQSVKDVIQSLVDDGYVDSEKIGTSTYFWAFPSKATQIRKGKIEQLETKVAELKKKIEENKQRLEEAMATRKDTAERQKLMEGIEELSSKKAKISKSLEAFKDSDPDIIAQEKKDIEMGKEAGNRWTDNIFSIRSFLKSKFGMEESVINENFGIPEDFDYLE